MYATFFVILNLLKFSSSQLSMTFQNPFAAKNVNGIFSISIHLAHKSIPANGMIKQLKDPNISSIVQRLNVLSLKYPIIIKGKRTAYSRAKSVLT